MNKPTVPRLNLAPKRRKPLSLWNPLDYLQLFYWIFFFPQALRWYVETFDKRKDANEGRTWQEKWRRWVSPLNRNFRFQRLVATLSGIFIAILVPFLLGHPLYVGVGCLAAVWAGIEKGVKRFYLRGFVGFISKRRQRYLSSRFDEFLLLVVLCIVIYSFLDNSLTYNIGAFFVLLVSLFLASFAVSFTTLSGIVLGVTSNLSSDATGETSESLSFYFWLSISFVLSIILAFSEGFLVIQIVLGIAFFTCFLVSLSFLPSAMLSIAVLRVDTWLVTTLLRAIPSFRSKVFSHTTSIALVDLTAQVSNWLSQDWSTAVHNTNQLLTYTRQSIPVIRAIHQTLETTSRELLVLRVSQIAEDPFSWDLIRYLSALSHTSLEEQIFPLPENTAELRIDTPARATAAGFWYLYTNSPQESVKAFSEVESYTYGLEMKQLSRFLDVALNLENLHDSELSTIFVIPSGSLLRPNTWTAIARLRGVIDDARIISQSYSRSARSFALNRAIGELANLLKEEDRIPRAERQIISIISTSWQEKLLEIASDIGEVVHTRPVRNPYVAGDPVEGSLFIGRGEVIKQIEELWLMSSQLQSVVLYGHRRMGKTSILKNLSSYLGININVAYINLLNLGTVSPNQGESEVLIALSDTISQTLSISSPSDEDFLQLPALTFQRFIRTISQQLNQGQGLIIALDEFEKIEELISTGALSKDFLGFLRGLLQEHANIAFAFAGLHTLEEMTEDYFNPLFASILPIRIGFFTLGETRQLLANPAEDFTLDYQPEDPQRNLPTYRRPTLPHPAHRLPARTPLQPSSI